MDAIQALSSKTTPAPVASGAAANDDSVANAFIALLGAVGVRFKGDNAGVTLDAKLLRTDDAAAVRTDDLRDAARDARDAAKVRDDKDAADRTATKPKNSKSDDDQDDTKTDQTKSASDDGTAEDTAASAAQTGQEQAAPQVVVVPVDVPLVTTDVLAPVLIAQQVATAVDPTAAQQTAVETVTAAAETAAVVGAAVETAAVTTGPTQKAATVAAPAAVAKTANSNVPSFKQAVVEAAAPVQADAAEDTAAAAPVAVKENTTAKSTDVTQANVLTQRSAAAQQQSQDLSSKVGPETKAQVHVTVNTQGPVQTTTTTSIYDIYAGYTSTQTSTANGQAGAAEATNALVQNSKASAEAAQAQGATSASPALAPQPQTPAAQQGASSSASSSSAARADISAPAPTQAGGSGSQSAPSYSDAGFGNAGSGAQSSSANATTAGAQTAPAERPLATAQQVIDQIKVNITRAAKAGLDRVTIRLKPVELGRVDVQLEMSEDHKVKVTVTADNKDTLNLLQTDSRTLERALNDAGLRTDTNNLHFSLRSDSDAQTAGDGKANGKNAAAADAGATDDADDIAMTYDYTEAARARGGIDTFA